VIWLPVMGARAIRHMRAYSSGVRVRLAGFVGLAGLVDLTGAPARPHRVAACMELYES